MKEFSIEFYVNKSSFIKTFDEVDISFISSILRRRLSKLDKGTIYTLNNVYDDNVQTIVFSSCVGEVERLIKIIEQYKTENEVSPNTFSGSVHNYPVGFFIKHINKEIPYNSISACDKSLTLGFLTSLISKEDNILYSYSDIRNDDIISCAINITKKNNGSSKYLLKSSNSNKETDFFEFASFFESKNDFIDCGYFSIERLSK